MSEPPSARPIVAIHQPNFFPWLGYFHKIRQSDTFVLLDDVQIQKTGGSVTNRATFVANGKTVYFTAPIDRSRSGALRIDEVTFAPREDFRERLVGLLRERYARAPFMKELGETVFALVREPSASLAAYNIAAITRIAELLGLGARFVRSSELGVTATSTERLVEIVARLGGKTYLAGAGAKDYQDDALFFARSIHVCYQSYEPPPYPRGKEPFVAGLSVLDALFLVGPAATRALLEQPLTDWRIAAGAAPGAAP